MRTEQQALRTSLVVVLVLAALGVSFGIMSGSFAIIFDGVFSLVDAFMSIVSIVVAGLITRSAANQLSRRTQERFNMGFWHFEPMILALNGLVMLAVIAYGMAQAISAIVSGGRDIEFGPAIAYAAIVLVLTATFGLIEHRATKRIGSALVAMDVKGWLMAGGVTGALLLAFIVGWFIDGTSAEWLMPYVDPAVLILVSLALLPAPIPMLRQALSEIALVAPPELREAAQRVAAEIGEEHGIPEQRVYVAQLGRGKTVDIVFHAPPDLPPRALSEWDAIRAQIRDRLAGDDPHYWLTITFTNLPPADAASPVTLPSDAT
ncbi:putative Co/Zn/Cd cation transporter (cation efflux family) [Kineosphaera limosa]|uniref:Putative CDF family transporter n=1 Tax=Kineosphaera limosa NBRC 100340 TaxID=1184609 RepID=K6VKX6_9MICO|nr:cation transporter [Kineosphaera limosa]NYE02779.1 putative Co/Zn/Cd cation transporter (cation efflux family) [Kineosphaera limosa]GAB96858.1 putative CDF family transporter [Kineosphaera limosa NBRC 100340]